MSGKRKGFRDKKSPLMHRELIDLKNILMI